MEESRVSMNEAFFDVVYWIPGSEQKLSEIFTKSKLEYGLFAANKIPFLIINFPNQKWNFDVSLNIKKIQQDKIESWLNSESNIINLYLCDWTTNIIYGMRMISLQKDVAELVRDILENQDEHYSESIEVDLAINNIMKSYTTADMMNNIKMIRL